MTRVEPHEVHEIIAIGALGWICTARACTWRGDLSAGIGHVVANQPDYRPRARGTRGTRGRGRPVGLYLGQRPSTPAPTRQAMSTAVGREQVNRTPADRSERAVAIGARS